MVKENTNIDILVVDDEPLIRNLLSSCLESYGHKVTFAKNGLDALFTLAEKDFGVVLMDLRMPVMDGLTAIDFIRKCERGEHYGLLKYAELAQNLSLRIKGRRIPVVAVTGNISEREAALHAGMDDFIKKPFNVKQVFDIINQFHETNTGDSHINRRKHQRYNIQDDGVFMSNGISGQVVDISRGGVAIMFTNMESVPNKWRAELSNPKEKVSIPELSLQCTRTGKKQFSQSFGGTIQTIGAIFNNPDIKQQTQIGEFIRGLA